MVKLQVDADDDPAFVELVGRAVNGSAALAGTGTLHLVKIDTWFGDRWFRFGGKTLGALGVRPRELVVPPFHPHRVVRESRFRVGEPPERLDLLAPLHGPRTSEANLRNALARHGESVTFAWYSGGTAANGRGAVMVYSLRGRRQDAWYAGLVRDGGGGAWRVAKLIGADAREWEVMVGAARAGTRDRSDGK